MEKEKFVILKINYISCEGNERWFTVKVPEGTSEYQLEERTLKYSGIGDDPAEYVSSEEYYEPGSEWLAYDWTDINFY